VLGLPTVINRLNETANETKRVAASCRNPDLIAVLPGQRAEAEGFEPPVP
jgi:hypothetical protein